LNSCGRPSTDAAGHRFYLAHIDGVLAASGWVAAFSASIGELGLAFAVPSHDRYLWDFVTLPAWRGHGIYPRVMQAILGAEAAHAGRFWIITAPENVASARGIAKAGFQEVSNLAFTPDHRPSAVVVDAQRQARAKIGAALLGVPRLEAIGDGQVLSPCWRCVLAEERIGAACWPDEHGIAVNCICS
jgi:GNAT superfamily N-acetyltransferase